MRKYLKLNIIRLETDTETRRQLAQTAIFIATPIKKLYLAVHFTQKVYFLTTFWNKNCEFNAKIFCACWRHKPSFYFFIVVWDKNEYTAKICPLNH